MPRPSIGSSTRRGPPRSTTSQRSRASRVRFEDPQHDCRVNVLGTPNLLEAAQRHAAPLVFTSTGGALYGNRAPIPTDEEWTPAPIAPYGASKWAGRRTSERGRKPTEFRTPSADSPMSRTTPESTRRSGCRRDLLVPPLARNAADAFRLRSSHARLRSRHRRCAGPPSRDREGRGVQHRLGRRDERARDLRRAGGARWTVGRTAPGAAPSGRAGTQLPGFRQGRTGLGWRAEIPLAEGLRDTYRALVEEFGASRPQTPLPAERGVTMPLACLRATCDKLGPAGPESKMRSSGRSTTFRGPCLEEIGSLLG